MIKISHLNHSDATGGAARAAYRIHRASLRLGMDSLMFVSRGTTGDATVIAPNSDLRRGICELRLAVGTVPRLFHKTSDPSMRSTSFIPSGWPKRLNASPCDLVHMHWVCNEMISIHDIGKFTKPIVWTLHDMWPFAGASHVPQDERWRDGYINGRPSADQWLDINRWTWSRKKRHWKRSMYIVTPSTWMENMVRESALMKDWPVETIHNCIDTEYWSPVDKLSARALYEFKSDSKILLFGAMGGSKNHNKGFDLLKLSLGHLRGVVDNLEIVVFGQLAPSEPIDLGFPVHYTGHLHDDLSLRLLYSAADALVIPSRQDNLPNTGIEALACGTPIIAFNTCGLPDLVRHQKTGWLAKAFDTEDLARGMQWILDDSLRLESLGHAARNYAIEKFSYTVVAEQYKTLYQRILTNDKYFDQ